MIKIIDQYEYVTIPEASAYLSETLRKDITEANLFRSALDGHLKLSVNFVNGVKVRRTEVVPPKNPEWIMIPANKSAVSRLINLYPEKYMECTPEFLANWNNVPEHIRGDYIPIFVLSDMNGERFDEENFLTKDPCIIEINGVWDLPMFGSERLDIEHRYHQLTGGPIVTLSCSHGAYVVAEDGVLCEIQIQEFDDQYIRLTASKDELRELKEHIATKMINRIEAQELLNKHNRKWELGSEATNIPLNEFDNYYSAESLPEDCVLVIRSSAMRDFEQFMERELADEGIPLPTITKPLGHLDHDQEMQKRANVIAAELKASTNKVPTKGKVAKLLAKELEMAEETVARRIRKHW